MEGHVKKRKSQRSAARAKEDRNVLEENSCKPVERDENHEKVPRRSWKRNFKDNPK
jgi:hypothetical protein